MTCSASKTTFLFGSRQNDNISPHHLVYNGHISFLRVKMSPIILNVHVVYPVSLKNGNSVIICSPWCQKLYDFCKSQKMLFWWMLLTKQFWFSLTANKFLSIQWNPMRAELFGYQDSSKISSFMLHRSKKFIWVWNRIRN